MWAIAKNNASKKIAGISKEVAVEEILAT